MPRLEGPIRAAQNFVKGFAKVGAPVLVLGGCAIGPTERGFIQSAPTSASSDTVPGGTGPQIIDANSGEIVVSTAEPMPTQAAGEYEKIISRVVGDQVVEEKIPMTPEEYHQELSDLENTFPKFGFGKIAQNLKKLGFDRGNIAVESQSGQVRVYITQQDQLGNVVTVVADDGEGSMYTHGADDPYTIPTYYQDEEGDEYFGSFPPAQFEGDPMSQNAVLQDARVTRTYQDGKHQTLFLGIYSPNNGAGEEIMSPAQVLDGALPSEDLFPQ